MCWVLNWESFLLLSVCYFLLFDDLCLILYNSRPVFSYDLGVLTLFSDYFHWQQSEKKRKDSCIKIILKRIYSYLYLSVNRPVILTHVWFQMVFVHPEVTVVVVVDRFYIMLFFTLEQAHCSLVTCDFKWETFTYNSAFFNVHLSDLLMALFGCYMVNAIWNCHRLGARSVYIIQPCVCLQCYFIPSHIIMCGACVFSCNLPPALLAKWVGSFMCYCGNTGVERIPK